MIYEIFLKIYLYLLSIMYKFNLKLDPSYPITRDVDFNILESTRTEVLPHGFQQRILLKNYQHSKSSPVEIGPGPLSKK